MTYHRDKNVYVLASRREVYANNGIFGLGMGDTLYHGYDGHVDDNRDDPLTEAERQEIADEMIARWQAWASTA